MKNNLFCIACENDFFVFKKSKHQHLYNKNCKLKIQKSIVPEKAIKINDWFNYINAEIKKKYENKTL